MVRVSKNPIEKGPNDIIDYSSKINGLYIAVMVDNRLSGGVKGRLRSVYNSEDVQLSRKVYA